MLLGIAAPERQASTVRAWLGWIMRNVKVSRPQVIRIPPMKGLIHAP